MENGLGNWKTRVSDGFESNPKLRSSGDGRKKE